MNKNFAKFLTCFIRDTEKRRAIRKRLIMGTLNHQKIKLIMTLVVKNEENIIEQNIRYHCAIGVDGFIVINHNSTDNTAKILEKLAKEGLVLDIINKTDAEHKLKVWVKELVNIAQKKYRADWVINADADEFYYSKSLNLKKSIAQLPKANLFFLDSHMVFPDNRKDFLTTPYFVSRLPHDFECDMLNIDNLDYFSIYSKEFLCPKVIIKTKDLKTLFDGNHHANMKNEVKVSTTDIVLYHFHIKNYDQLEAKVIKWQKAAKLKPKGNGEHLKRLIKYYEEGKLKEYYNSKYGDEKRKKLINAGFVHIDNSLSCFLKHKKII